jgi:hypothetical protein
MKQECHSLDRDSRYVLVKIPKKKSYKTFVLQDLCVDLKYDNLLHIIIIMAVQPIVGPWPLFQFLDPIHSR